MGQTTKLNSSPASETNNHTLFHITNENIKLTNTQSQTFLKLVPSMIFSQNYQHSVLENKNTFRIYYHAITLIHVVADHGDRIEEISKLSWLMEFPKHAMCADFLHSHHLLLISIWRIFVSLQPTQWHPPQACWNNLDFSRRCCCRVCLQTHG